MVQLRTFLAVAATAGLAAAVPLRFQKRIAQVIAESTADWQEACLAAGGAQQCNPIAQTAFSSLLAAGGNCDQQDAADLMIDLAKTLGNDPEMIRLAQLFVQQPRNTPEGTQTPYCGVAPQNAELNGLFHCQFEGSVNKGFSGNGEDNLPLGVAVVDPVGSCPALNGPVPDGVQLNTLVQDPGAGAAAAAPAATNAGAANTGAAANAGAAANNGAAANRNGAAANRNGAAANAGAAANNGAAGAAAGANNGVAGAAAGAGANNGAAGAAGAAPAAPVAAPAAPAAAPVAGARPFTLANGQQALAENASFAALNANSPCTAGQTACVDGGFAQCVNGSFAITPCAGGTQCFSLPLVNSPGTSLTCSSEADKDARIAATGAA